MTEHKSLQRMTLAPIIYVAQAFMPGNAKVRSDQPAPFTGLWRMALADYTSGG